MIGIISGYDGINYRTNKSYIDAVNIAGGKSVILNYGDIDIDFLSGILLTGGGDFSEEYINEKLDSRATDVYIERDRFEVETVIKAIKKNIPILGICRGAQVLNIACGGTIIQHIQGHIQKEERSKPSHYVHIDKNSTLYKIIQNGTCFVNSFHHQVIGKLGENIKSSAVSSDGYIEAIEHNNMNFCIGVQWHPEAIINQREQSKLFEEFVKHTIDFDM